MPAQIAPPTMAADDGDDQVDDRTAASNGEADPAGDRGGDEHLALAADVEQAGAEAERDAETGGDQRGREGRASR